MVLTTKRLAEALLARGSERVPKWIIDGWLEQEKQDLRDLARRRLSRCWRLLQIIGGPVDDPLWYFQADIIIALRFLEGEKADEIQFPFVSSFGSFFSCQRAVFEKLAERAGELKNLCVGLAINPMDDEAFENIKNLRGQLKPAYYTFLRFGLMKGADGSGRKLLESFFV